MKVLIITDEMLGQPVETIVLNEDEVVAAMEKLEPYRKGRGIEISGPMEPGTVDGLIDYIENA